jgi:hypothetical protein
LVYGRCGAGELVTANFGEFLFRAVGWISLQPMSWSPPDGIMMMLPDQKT